MKRHSITMAALAAAIAAVSLNAAALGPDVAGKTTTRLTTSQIERLIVRIANREITRRARGLRVGSAANADRAGSAVSAGVSNSATSALTANSATSALTANRANAATVADNATFATSSNRAVRADTAGSANTAGSASTAAFAASANPVMYAKVSANGEIDPAFSKGISQGNLIFFGGGRGKSCFSGLPPIKGGVATVDALQTPNNDVPFTAHFTVGAPGQDSGGDGCNVFPETQFGVATYGPSENDLETQSEDIGYFIVVYQ